MDCATGSFCSSCAIPPRVVGGLWSDGVGCDVCVDGERRKIPIRILERTERTLSLPSVIIYRYFDFFYRQWASCVQFLCACAKEPRYFPDRGIDRSTDCELTRAARPTPGKIVKTLPLEDSKGCGDENLSFCVLLCVVVYFHFFEHPLTSLV